jgi:hypothetical protein
MAADARIDAVALQTLALLQQRLQRLEFLFTGKSNHQDDKDESDDEERDENDAPVVQRVQKLQHGLNKLAAKFPHIANILRIRMCPLVRLWYERLIACYVEAIHPNLFTDAPDPPHPPPPTVALSTVLAAAPTIQAVSSQLLSLADSPASTSLPSDHQTVIPDTKAMATWVALAPRIAELELMQRTQAEEISRLRVRSAAVVSRWYDVQTLAAGRVWVEWEGRVRKCEREVSRRDAYLKEVDWWSLKIY